MSEKLDRFEHSEKSLNKKVNDISIELDIASDKNYANAKIFLVEVHLNTKVFQKEI